MVEWDNWPKRKGQPLPSKLTPLDLENTANMTSREAARVLGVGKSTVSRARQEAARVPVEKPVAPGYRFEQSADGAVDASTRPSEAPQTLDDALQVLRDKGLELDAYNVTYSYSEWESGDNTLHSYRVRATPKPVDSKPKLDPDELLAVVDSYEPVITSEEVKGSTLVVTPSDLQIGKVDYHGGSEDTIARVRKSIAKAVTLAQRNSYSEIVIAELGDVVENFYNTSAQRETNDLDITSQIRVARRLLLEAILALAPYTSKLTYVSVPSNHGSVRVGFKAEAGAITNDWGLEISHQLEDAVTQNPDLKHVQFVRPEGLHESLAYETNGTVLGFVHGHQSRSAEKLGEWWKGQSHGKMPVANADILVTGHWHSFRVQQSGNARWLMVSPTSDNGSSWFTENTGESSQTGMLCFETFDGQWENVRIL